MNIPQPHFIPGMGPIPSINPPQHMMSNPNAVLTKRQQDIAQLYEKLPVQCKQCGLRWAEFPSGSKDLSLHLDSHFRVAKRKREMGRCESRGWYLPVSAWVSETLAEETEGVLPVFFESANPVPDTEIDSESKQKILADVAKKCCICNEEFEKSYDVEMEDWVVCGAVLVGSSVTFSC